MMENLAERASILYRQRVSMRCFGSRISVDINPYQGHSRHCQWSTQKNINRMYDHWPFWEQSEQGAAFVCLSDHPLYSIVDRIIVVLRSVSAVDAPWFPAFKRPAHYAASPISNGSMLNLREGSFHVKKRKVSPEHHIAVICKAARHRR